MPNRHSWGSPELCSSVNAHNGAAQHTKSGENSSKYVLNSRDFKPQYVEPAPQGEFSIECNIYGLIGGLARS
eukprot:scaffold37469_cov20-Tisochrysis_lutea.AAC.2